MGGIKKNLFNWNILLKTSYNGKHGKRKNYIENFYKLRKYFVSIIRVSEQIDFIRIEGIVIMIRVECFLS